MAIEPGRVNYYQDLLTKHENRLPEVWRKSSHVFARFYKSIDLLSSEESSLPNNISTFFQKLKQDMTERIKKLSSVIEGKNIKAIIEKGETPLHDRRQTARLIDELYSNPTIADPNTLAGVEFTPHVSMFSEGLCCFTPLTQIIKKNGYLNANSLGFLKLENKLKIDPVNVLIRNGNLSNPTQVDPNFLYFPYHGSNKGLVLKITLNTVISPTDRINILGSDVLFISFFRELYGLKPIPIK